MILFNRSVARSEAKLKTTTTASMRTVTRVSFSPHCRIFWTPASELSKQVTVVLVPSKVQRVVLPTATSDQSNRHQGVGWAKQETNPSKISQIRKTDVAPIFQKFKFLFKKKI